MLIRKRIAKEGGRLTYRPSISICNTNPVLLREIIKRTGINRVYQHIRTPQDHHRAESYTWRMTSTDIERLVPSLLPWLFIKRRQAELLLEFITYARHNACTGGKPRQMMGEVRRHEIYQEIRNLNRRGRTNEPVIW
jgi:hypothetical protein